MEEEDTSKVPAFTVSVGMKPTGSRKTCLNFKAKQLRHLEHNLLGWGLSRLDYMRKNLPRARWKAIQALKDTKERNEAYEALWAEVGLTMQAMYELQQEKQTHYKHLNGMSAICGKLAKKTFDRIFKYAIGKTGRPRFQSSLGNKLLSLEAKELHSAIVVKADTVTIGGDEFKLRWDKNNPHHTEARKQIINYYKFREISDSQGIQDEIQAAKGCPFGHANSR